MTQQTEGQSIVQQFMVPEEPNYIPQDHEEQVFEHACNTKIPLILKGPTGCGKTRFVEHMAYQLKLPLITVSCHEDLTASDLVGRFLFKDNQTVWQDGPLTLAVRYGGICYLDEIVEARNDTAVVIHSLTDDRRILYVDKTGEVIRAHKDFMMVMSYNPGYQNVAKDLKHSTKQRFCSLIFDQPSTDTEVKIITSETGLAEDDARKLAEMGKQIRSLKGFGLDEGVSCRLLVYVARLMKSGLDAPTAITVAISQTLSDETEIIHSVEDIAKLYFGDMLEEEKTEHGA